MVIKTNSTHDTDSMEPSGTVVNREVSTNVVMIVEMPFVELGDIFFRALLRLTGRSTCAAQSNKQSLLSVSGATYCIEVWFVK